jgi:hypothetical protein
LVFPSGFWFRISGIAQEPTMTHVLIRMMLALTFAAALQWTAAAAFAQDAPDDTPPPAPVVAQPAPVVAPAPAPAPGNGSAHGGGSGTQTAAPPSADQVMDQLLEARQPAPLIEPTEQPRRSASAPPVIADIDPAVLGVAPGAPPPPLKREGSFVIARQGRLQRSSDGAHRLFVFEADGKHAPELPMILLPCQMLQNMEDLVQQRGDRVVFILSGQITSYRGANYLLPTMMRLAIDDGNL